MPVSRQVAALAAMSILSLSCADDDGGNPDECRALAGPFSSTVGDPCDSPVGLCTHGMLAGEFAAKYDFTFETLTPANDPSDPTKMVYTGKSVVTLLDGSGVIYTDDTGVIQNQPSGVPSPFTTKAIAVKTEGSYRGTFGGFVAMGTLSMMTGQATGTYSAVLCE